MNDGATKTNVIVGYTNKNSDYNHHRKPPTSKDRKTMNVIKLALNMLRKKGVRTSKKLSPSLPTSTNVTLTNLVGAIRPLYLQRDFADMSSPSSPPQLLPGHEMAEVRSTLNERFEVSPCHPKYAPSSSSSSRSSYSGGGMSRYASAQSLYDLHNHEDDGEKNEEGMMSDGDAYYDGLEGDEMIDAKADMFIAMFYQQMRLQDY